MGETQGIAMKVRSDDDYDSVFGAIKSQGVLDENGKVIPEPADIEVVRAEHPTRSEEALFQLARARRLLRLFTSVGRHRRCWQR